jgi:hypothetical protein
MATSLTDDNFDWCSFYALFWNVRSPISHPQTRTFAIPNSRNKSANYFLVGKMSTPKLTLSPPHPPNRSQDRGLKLKLRMVETVLFRDGRLSSWWFTDKVRPRRARNLPVFFFFSFSHFLLTSLVFAVWLFLLLPPPTPNTKQDGIIRKKAPTRATLEAVRQRFMHVGFALHDATNAGKYACIERRGGGAPPRLQRRDGFNALVEVRRA